MVNSSWTESLSATAPEQAAEVREPVAAAGCHVVDKSVPAEIFNRITKMREAVAALDKQLRTTILTGRKYNSWPDRLHSVARITNIGNIREFDP